MTSENKTDNLEEISEDLDVEAEEAEDVKGGFMLQHLHKIGYHKSVKPDVL